MHTDPHLSVLVERQNGLCQYCKLPMDARGHHRATADHVKARSRGGADTLENKVAACAWCNNLKGSMSLAKWLSIFPQLVKFRNQPPAHAKEQIKKIRGAVRLSPKDNGTPPKKRFA